MGGPRIHASRCRPRAAVAGALAAALALGAAACGGGDSSSATGEAAGSYPVEVTSASFPTRQRLGQTSLLRLGIRNAGERTIPALTVDVSVAGEEGRNSTLPFAIRDPQSDLAQPDRPVWVLAERYPRLAGSEEPGGTETFSDKTFDFGRLEPGATADVVWKLSAVRAGRWGLRYGIGAGTGGEAKAVTRGGVRPGGSFAVRISRAPLGKEVTDSGEVVPIGSRSGSR